MGYVRKKEDSVKKFIKDPVRVVAALGTGGASEMVRAGAKEVLKPEEPPTPEMPVFGQDAANAAINAAELEQRKRAGRGRSANMVSRFSRGLGLGSSSTNFLRRTLTGS